MSKKRIPGIGFLNRVMALGIGRIMTLFLIAAVGGWFTFTLTLAGISRNTNPALALKYWPTESVALAEQADQLFFADPMKSNKKVFDLAQKALRQQTVNAKALRLLGYYADAKHQPLRAKMLITQAAKLSRREPGAQLWLIEAEAREGNTKKTLVHYDILLRTKTDSKLLLFPRLINAITEPDVRAALKPYMRNGNSWISGFLGQALYTGQDTSALVNLIVESHGFPPLEMSRSQETALLRRLANEKRFDDVHRIYRLMPGAKTARLTDASFDETDRDSRYGPVGWLLLDDPEAGGGFSGKQSSTHPNLQLFANSSTTRIIASKLLYLQTGTYRFNAKLASIERSDGGFLRWQLRCANDPSNRANWILEMDAKTAATNLTVPAGCPVQYLDIVISGGRAQIGMEAVVSDVSITTQIN
jgi:hypothetical protein